MNEYIQKYFDSTKYNPFNNDKLQRYGLMYSNNHKGLYCGDWLGNKRHGKGIYYASNFTRYEGDFLDDCMHGKSIMYVWLVERKTYEGDIKNGDMNGKGIFYFPNNIKYEGDILDGKMHGIGLISDSKGKKVYYGEFKNGERVYNY